MEKVRIEKLVYGGDGLGRLDGQVVFVPFTAPGDEVLVSISDRKKDYLVSDLVQIFRPGEGRRQAPCPYFQDCGGCQLQHLEYAQQQVQKRQILLETLTRGLPGIALPDLEWVDGPEFSYRRNVRFQVGDTAAPGLGFYRPKSREVVDIEVCPLLIDPLNAAYSRLRRSGLLAGLASQDISGVRAIYSSRQNKTLFAVLAKGARRCEEPRIMAWFGDDGRTIEPLAPDSDERVEESIGEWVFRIHPLSFFQSNAFLTEKLVGLVRDTAENLSSRNFALELFSGTGLFTMSLSRTFGRTVAVEQDRRAAEDAVRNEMLNGASGIEWVQAAVDPWLERQGSRLFPDLLLVDPPREGLGKTVSRWALQALPDAIAYVSCSPPTLARDLKRWVGDNSYRLVRLVGLDLFPQTFHIETLAVLKRTDR